jgi:diaminohydroxyphosphoribosylaminopyrimidine deaminase/5-amino-6-(5-phosphoribosylamino)uracil reductase
VQSGVSRVVAAMRDPNPLVNGRGFALLRSRGIAVDVGLGADLARRLNRSFVKHVRSHIPYVTLKEAVSLDGRIALASGRSRYLSGVAARRLSQRLRWETDAILVGIGTALADDPALSARRGGRVVKPLVRAVVDTALRIEPSARLLRGLAVAGPVRVYTAAGAGAKRCRELETRGAVVVEVPRRRGRVDLDAVLADLGRVGVGRLLVEGGGEVAASLFREGLVDRLVLHMAPIVLGGDARPAVGALGIAALEDAPRLTRWTSRSVGSDRVLEGEVSRVHRHR